jgi:hypothetical protein
MDNPYGSQTNLAPGGTVRAHSFVVGRKVCNQTTIDLLTAETGLSQLEESKTNNCLKYLGPNPIKVIYVKPSLQMKEAAKPLS